jgi:hypothetical protein
MHYPIDNLEPRPCLPASRPAPGPVFPGLELVLRVLALLDALLIPGLVGYWITTLPGKGQLVGAVLGTWMAWWAIKRGSKALLAFDEYRWFCRHLAKLLAAGLLLQLVAWMLR